MNETTRWIVCAMAVALLTPVGAQAQVGFEEVPNFNEFTKTFGGNFRWGNNSGTNGDWEFSVVNGSDSPLDQQNWAWNDNTYDFSFVYDPTALYSVSLTVGGVKTSQASPTFGSGLSINQIAIWQRVISEDGLTAQTAALRNLEVRVGGSLFASATELATTGTDDKSMWMLSSSNTSLAAGFTISGQVQFQNGWQNSKPNIAIKVGEGPTEVVPEPATLLLFGTGLVGLGVVARRRRREDGEPDEV